MLLLTLRGTPTVYYGDELGMPESDIPVESIQDPWGQQFPELSRDGCRTPMQWTDEQNAGFSVCAQETWLPVQPDYAERNVEAQLQDDASHLNLYRKLLSFRKQSRALQAGAYAPVDGAPEDCYVYIRSIAEERIGVALNFSDKPREITLPAAGTLNISTYMDTECRPVSDTLTLRPHEGLIVTL